MASLSTQDSTKLYAEYREYENILSFNFRCRLQRGGDNIDDFSEMWDAYFESLNAKNSKKHPTEYR